MFIFKKISQKTIAFLTALSLSLMVCCPIIQYTPITAFAAATNATQSINAPQNPFTILPTDNKTAYVCGEYANFSFSTTQKTTVNISVSDENLAYIANITRKVKTQTKQYNQTFTPIANVTYKIRIRLLKPGTVAVKVKDSNNQAFSRPVSISIYKMSTQNDNIRKLLRNTEKCYKSLPQNLRSWLESEVFHIELKDEPYMMSSKGIKAIGLGGWNLSLCTGALKSFDSTFYHEIGHVIHYHLSQHDATFDTYLKNIYNLYKQKKYFREYAKSNFKEFFADVISLYFNNPDTLKTQFPSLYNFADLVVNFPETFAYESLDDVSIMTIEQHEGYCETIKAVSLKQYTTYTISQNQAIKLGNDFYYKNVFFEVYKGKKRLGFYNGNIAYPFNYTGIYKIKVLLPFADQEHLLQTHEFTVTVVK